MIGWLRRNWRQVAAAAGLLAALVALLFAVQSVRRLRSSGAQLVSEALSGMLDREVEVGRVELGFGDDPRYPEGATYRNLGAFRELKLTRESVETVESYPPDIWFPIGR